MRRLVVLVTLAACGDNHSAVDLPPDGGVCTTVVLGEPDFQFDLFNQLTGLRYPTGEGDLVIELRPPVATGTFDLADERDPATCQHCVSLDGYFQREGTMTITQVGDFPFDPVFAGTLEGVVLAGAGDDCVALDDLAFDTSPTPGAACLDAEDCGNPLLEICDPGANVCAAPQCGDFVSCPGNGQVCLSQYHDLFEGACYESCDPTVLPGDCGAGERCVQLGVDPAFGICKTVGDGAIGEDCEVTDNGTSCAGKGVCSRESGTCTSSCSFFEDAPGCADGSLCSLFGVCEPPSAGEDVPVGTACALDAELAEGCAPDGEAFRGICFAFPPDPTVCEEACLGDLGCEAGEFCALRFSSGLGICKPLPVCGDGELGEINELCDDGNNDSGDGCSGDCQTVEYDVICASVPALGFDTPTAGDTATGWDGFQASCQAGIARAELFEVTPPGPGRLRLSVTSPSVQVVSLRADCTNVAADVGCSDYQIELQITDVAPAPLTAMVSAFTVLEEGPFTVTAEFVAENCGDSIIAGNEVCDDGNTGSNDGCRGDCRAIEYDVWCAAATPLSTTAVNNGDTTGGPALFDSACSATEGDTSGPDDLYSFTAPAAGTLHLHLDDTIGGDLLIVSVLDACGDPATVNELSCRPGFLGGDLDVAMTAGQAIALVVDGFAPDDAGAYALTASFAP